jgi:hypothetical protein
VGVVLSHVTVSVKTVLDRNLKLVRTSLPGLSLAVASPVPPLPVVEDVEVTGSECLLFGDHVLTLLDDVLRVKPDTDNPACFRERDRNRLPFQITGHVVFHVVVDGSIRAGSELLNLS